MLGEEEESELGDKSLINTFPIGPALALHGCEGSRRLLVQD